MHNSCCRDIIRRLRISIATGCELSATGKLTLFLSSTGIFRYFLGRIAEIIEIEKSDRRNQLQKENHTKITCDSFLINMFCYFAPRTSRNKDTDECYGKLKQVNQGLSPWRWRRGHCWLETSATRNKAQQRNMLLSIRRWYFMFDCLCTLSCPFDGNFQRLHQLL